MTFCIEIISESRAILFEFVCLYLFLLSRGRLVQCDENPSVPHPPRPTMQRKNRVGEQVYSRLIGRRAQGSLLKDLNSPWRNVGRLSPVHVRDTVLFCCPSLHHIRRISYHHRIGVSIFAMPLIAPQTWSS